MKIKINKKSSKYNRIYTAIILFGLFILIAVFVKFHQKWPQITEIAINSQNIRAIKLSHKNVDKYFGSGWYSNIAVGNDNTVHLAFTDATSGTIHYTTLDKNNYQAKKTQKIQDHGSIGHYLKLSLAAGKTPILSYFDAINKIFAISYPKNTTCQNDNTKWVKQNIAFGEECGAASNLHINSDGLHITYYCDTNSFRYAYKSQKELFSQCTNSSLLFNKLIIDNKLGAGQHLSSQIITNKLNIIALLTSKKHFEHKIYLAILKKDKKLFNKQLLASFTSKSWPPLSKVAAEQNKNGTIDLFFPEQDEIAMIQNFDPAKYTESTKLEGKTLLPLQAPAIIKKDSKNNIWMLLQIDKRKKKLYPGLWLLKFNTPSFTKVNAFNLKNEKINSSWFDLAIDNHNKPIAVWYSPKLNNLQYYYPK